jgi:hypothetical protein
LFMRTRPNRGSDREVQLSQTRAAFVSLRRPASLQN